MYCLTSSSEVNRLPSEPFLGDQKWRNRRERGLDCVEGDLERRSTHAPASFYHVPCTREPLAAGSELPRSCLNHSLLRTKQYFHRFAHSRLRLVSFLMPLARLFLNAPYSYRTINQEYKLVAEYEKVLLFETPLLLQSLFDMMFNCILISLNAICI